jgi:hypothetical protein
MIAMSIYVCTVFLKKKQKTKGRTQVWISGLGGELDVTGSVYITISAQII